jgi:hypothetical protein
MMCSTRVAGRLRRGSGSCSEKDQSLDLPKQAHRDLDALSELRAIFDGLYELAGHPIKPMTADDNAQTRCRLREPTKMGKCEIHEEPLSCTRAAPIAQLRGDCKTDPPLILIPGLGVWVRDLPTNGSPIDWWIKWM